jgi:5-methyltetrahydropteroyltriglutamate--homocysteine methyltransferase
LDETEREAHFPVTEPALAVAGGAVLMAAGRRIKTTHVGSLPRPGDLCQLLGEALVSRSADDHRAVEQRAARAVEDVVARQLDAGIDIVSDGEQAKPGFVNYVKDRLTGFDGQSRELAFGDLLDFGGSAQSPGVNWVPACTGPIVYVDPQAYAADIRNFRAALQQTQHDQGFLTAISPGNAAMVMANEYYPSRTEYLGALADAMKEEYRAILDAGFDLQLDACDLAMDRHVTFYGRPLADFRRNIEENVAALNYAISGLPQERIRVHVCWGNYPGPHHLDVPLQDIVDVLLRIRCGALSFEAANPRHEHEWTVWAEADIPEELVLLPGVVDTVSTHLEHPEVVATRIARFVEIVGPERIVASTDCGAGSLPGFERPEALAYAKFGTLRAGADLASSGVR